VLDEADPIAEAYYLEVSSPGIEREIRTEEHILLSLGSKVEAKLFAAVEGKKHYVGILESYDSEKNEVVIDGMAIPRNMISKMNIYFDFT